MGEEQTRVSQGLSMLLANVISTPVATVLLRYIEEKEQLFIIAALSAMGLTALKPIVQSWHASDGEIDAFENVSLTILNFVYWICYFLTMQFGVGLVMSTMTLFAPPSVPAVILLGIIVLVVVISFVPLLVSSVVTGPVDSGPRVSDEIWHWLRQRKAHMGNAV